MRAGGLCARLGGLVLLTALPGSASAVCQSPTHFSPCIDSNALWPAPGDTHFLSIASPAPTAQGRVAFGIQGQFLFRPLVARVPSPIEEGREVRLVEYALDQTLLLEAGLSHGLSLGLSIGVALHQRGAGIEGITSQRGAPLGQTAERDAGLSLAYSRRLSRSIAVEPRVLLLFPVGDETAFAGGDGFSAAPAIAVEAHFGQFRMGADLGLRLRRSVEFGTARLGSQASLALGVSWEIVDKRRFWLSGEAFALPSLTDENSKIGKTLGIRTRLVPAEWLLSLGIRPDPDSGWSLLLGSGSGLPFSREVRDETVRMFLGPTSPILRTVVALRYVPMDGP